jgi:transcriptional regulator NrdR family protein
VLGELTALDPLAAARFASVFRDFKTAADYDAFFASLDEAGLREPPAR